MQARFSECDLESLRLLADDHLSSWRIAELQGHLETCGSCREVLDNFIGADGLIEAARQHLGSEATGRHDGEPAHFDLLSGLSRDGLARLARPDGDI